MTSKFSAILRSLKLNSIVASSYERCFSSAVCTSAQMLTLVKQSIQFWVLNFIDKMHHVKNTNRYRQNADRRAIFSFHCSIFVDLLIKMYIVV